MGPLIIQFLKSFVSSSASYHICLSIFFLNKYVSNTSNHQANVLYTWFLLFETGDGKIKDSEVNLRNISKIATSVNSVKRL